LTNSNLNLFIIFLIIFILFSACDTDPDSSTTKLFENFSFLASRNPDYLKDDVNGYILGSEIYLGVPYGTDTSKLIADFETTGTSVTVNGMEQISGVTVNNYNNSELNPVVYSVEADDGTVVNYSVRVPQVPWLKSLYTAGSIDNDYANYITLDSIGNIYITGAFRGNAYFNPDNPTEIYNNYSGNSNLADIFITKFNYNGTYAWTKTIGGNNDDLARKITVDSDNNIYITGEFRSTSVDFNPDPVDEDIHNNSGVNTSDIFISKYNKNGTYAWTKTIGGSGGNNIYSGAIELDNENNIYITGNYTGTIDFDPGPGTDPHPNTGFINFFLTKLDYKGLYCWTRTIQQDECEGIALIRDSNDNLFVGGHFVGNIKFDPSESSYFITNHTIFITKINSDDSYAWTEIISRNADAYLSFMTADKYDNIYITGNFPIMFYPDPDDSSLRYNGTNDIFIAKYNSNVDYIWSSAILGGGNDSGYSIFTDDNEYAYMTGTLNNDIIISKLNKNGNTVWEYLINGTNTDIGYSIAVSQEGCIYFAGSYNGTVTDFNPDSGPPEPAPVSANSDIFLAELIPH
jgi:hypothetical protein